VDAAQILKDFDVDLIRRLRPALGEFDTLALSARYDFTSEEYRIGSILFATQQQVPEVIKTIFHETTHLYQALSTPYGYYYYSLRAFQSNQVVVMLRMIRETCNVKVKYPLISSIASLEPKEKFQELWFSLYLWYLAEILLLYMEGDRYIYLRQARNNPLLKGKRIINCFAEMEFYLSAFFAATGRSFEYPGHNLSSAEESWKEQRAMTVLKTLGDVDVINLLESWAKTSEHWECQGEAFPDPFFPHTMSVGQSKYYFLLNHAKNILKVANIQEFILTYAALCELSLFGPILPQHHKFRGGWATMKDIHPLSRLFLALPAAADIEPVRNLDSDYERFVEQVCYAKGWPTPLAMSEDTLSHFHYMPQDLLSDLYHRAQKLRMLVPSAFINLSVWYTPKDDFTRELTYYFVHPVMEFRDKTLFHKDKEIVQFFGIQYTVNSYLRKLLLSDDLTVTLPFQVDRATLAFYENVLTAHLEMAAGIRRPKILLKARSSGVPH